MQTSTAYFAGAGTVVIAVVVGLGGGLLIANSMSSNGAGQPIAKLERRTTPASLPGPNPQQPSSAQSAPSALPTSYLAATAAAAAKPVVVESAPRASDPPQQAAAQPQPTPATTTANAARAQIETPVPSAVETAQSQANATDAALAKAQDSDLKSRDSDLKRSAARRRNAERRQQWAERRRSRPRDPDLREVEQAVREDSGPRAYVVEPIGAGTPRFRLFDAD